MTLQIDAGVTVFTNGHSLIQDGQSYAGVVVVSNTKITWAESHLSGMSAQKAELEAMKTSLELRKKQDTEGWCVIATSHIHGAIYKERSLLMRKD